MNFDKIADCMKGGLSSAANSDDIRKFLDACRIATSDMKIDMFIDEGLSKLEAAMVMRSAVIERIGLINETLKVSLSRGHLLPDSPFPKIDLINSTRPLFGAINLSYSDQASLYNAAVELSSIAKQYSEGKITFARKSAAQLASYEVSVDGIVPQSGDPLSDILGYQPDGDFVKRKRILDGQARLDFSKKKPYILFTIEMPRGVAICWSKMRDASGYTISRRDVFYDEESPDIVLDNISLAKSTADLLANDHFFQALSFYDWVTSNDVVGYLDETAQRDTLYSYAISGIQKKAPVSPFIFDTPVTSLFFSPALNSAAQTAIEQEASRFSVDAKAISPYPALSKAVYGDPSFGWILAGCNVLAATRRGATVDEIRSMSFIGSTAEFIFSQARAGKIVIPSDIKRVQAAVDAAVTSYGVSQAILSVLDGVGATHFISGKDDQNGIQPTQSSIEGSTSGLARIISAIDPETATIDPKLIMAGGQSSKISAGQIDSMPDGFGDIPDKGFIDLTTYSGIGSFMQIIRAVYDFFPGALI